MEARVLSASGGKRVNYSVILLLLAALFSLLLCLEISFAQEQPKPEQPKPEQPKQPEQPKPEQPKQPEPEPPAPPKKEETPPNSILKQFYREEKAKEDSFTCNDVPAFQIHKPGDKWHFVDLAKLQAAQLANQKDETGRKEIEDFYKVCKCIMHNEETDAVVRVFTGRTDKNLKDVVSEVEFSAQKNFTGFKLISRTPRNKCEAEGASITFEGTPQNQKKVKYVVHIFVKNGCVYQLHIMCEKGKFAASEKDFKKIYEKWKF